jgi:hypothetical protein
MSTHDGGISPFLGFFLKSQPALVRDCSPPEQRKKGEAMNDPTAILELDRQRIGAAERWGGMATTTRRFVCLTALILVFLVIGVGGVPGSESRARESLTLEPGLFDHGLTLLIVGKPASADTVADAEQVPEDECVCYEDKFSTILIRHKTH